MKAPDELAPRDPRDTTSPPVLLVDYDPTWPERFRAEQAAIATLLGSHLKGPIEHVGSTAVPGLLAKPIIDIMVGVTSLAESTAIIPLLQTLGYHYFPYRADVMHWFCKPSPTVRTHHVHAVPVTSQLWRDRLAFRDFLRQHQNVTDEYADLKRRLAELHRDDREAYTDAKTGFVERVLAMTR